MNNLKDCGRTVEGEFTFICGNKKSHIDKYIFDKKYTSSLMENHFNRKKDNRKLLWTLFVLENWLKNNQFSVK